MHADWEEAHRIEPNAKHFRLLPWLCPGPCRFLAATREPSTSLGAKGHHQGKQRKQQQQQQQQQHVLIGVGVLFLIMTWLNLAHSSRRTPVLSTFIIEEPKMVTVRYTKAGVIRYTAYAFTETGVHHLQIDLFVDIRGRRLDRAGEVWLCSQCWGSFEMGIVLGCGWWLVDCWGYHFFWEGLSEKLGRWTCRSSCSKWWMHGCMIK